VHNKKKVIGKYCEKTVYAEKKNKLGFRSPTRQLVNNR